MPKQPAPEGLRQGLPAMQPGKVPQSDPETPEPLTAAFRRGSAIPSVETAGEWGHGDSTSLLQSQLISDLTIQPTAAYLLAAQSVPDEARQEAIERAEAGEEITTAVAKEIVAETKKKRRPRRRKSIAADKLGLRLAKVLERYRDRWNQDQLSELA